MSVRRLNRANRAALAAGEALEPRLAEAWAREVEWTWRLAAQRLEAYARSLVASWQPPVDTELVNSERVEQRLTQQTAKLRSAIVVDAAKAVARVLDAPWDVRNAMVQGTLERQGTKITGIVDTERVSIMRVVNTAWEDGLSIPKTARLIRDTGAISSAKRGQVIARTEMIQAVNAGSLAQVQVVNDAAIEAGEDPIAEVKVWLATADERTREWHAEADGQTVPLSGTFSVGPDQMRFPGDPDGSAANVVNCRCTLTYG